jgi:hypothetical protein
LYQFSAIACWPEFITSSPVRGLLDRRWYAALVFSTTHPRLSDRGDCREKMKAAVFVEPGRIVLEDKPVPQIGPLHALVKITTTTICGTDIHILKRKVL